MANLSLPFAGQTPGLYQVCTNANTDYAVAIPAVANNAVPRSLVVWFETSVSDSTIVKGRVAFGLTNTALTPITGTDALMGYHPPVPVEYELGAGMEISGNAINPTYVHLACSIAGAVARGMWLRGR